MHREDNRDKRLCESKSCGPLEHLESLIVAEGNSEDNVEAESVVKIHDLHVKSGYLEKAAFEASSFMSCNVNQQVRLFLKLVRTRETKGCVNLTHVDH